MTVAYRKTSIGRRAILERWSQQSEEVWEEGNEVEGAQVCSTDPSISPRCPRSPRELHSISVEYTANDAMAPVTAIAKLDSGLGAAYDMVLKTFAFPGGVGNFSEFWAPEEPLPIMEDDVIVVTCPTAGLIAFEDPGWEEDIVSRVIIVTKARE